MITVDLNKPTYWVLSGKTHTIVGPFYTSLAAAMEAATTLAKKENTEALIVQGVAMAVHEIRLKSFAR